METMLVAQELPGLFGIVANLFCENLHDHELQIENNQIVNEELNFSNWNKSPEKRTDMCRSVPKRYKQSVCITLRGKNDEVSKELRGWMQNHYVDYELLLGCSTISPAWMKWALSFPKLTRLSILKKSEDAALEFYKALVERGRLRSLDIYYDVSLHSKEMDVIEIALCQKQFKRLILQNCEALEELLSIWEENREKMIRKEIFFFDCGVVAKDLKGDLELCSQEQCDYIKKEHIDLYQLQLCIPSEAYKIKSELIADDKHNIYVLFDCFQKGEEVAEFDFFTETDQIVVLFS
ncbi:hypothetical protein QR680_006572 [Steinernema hermaphroditum]|uniref:Uncharacterized protein n=1 Tax=Steinernema hermaphroditum TaxID=289476 RepID=A0AA39HX45_9BILA|nr:hypothetical protein QR680_006572 [Steinernema hermaphroditum]